MVPLPCFSVPSHTADPVRVAIVFPPLIVAWLIRPRTEYAQLVQTRLSKNS
jgi:hypothetical protein